MAPWRPATARPSLQRKGKQASEATTENARNATSLVPKTRVHPFSRR